MKIKLLALIDCSSFYCSCERAFRPDLDNTPICVLSNNDGCIVSLTPEVKELGVYIGSPYFIAKEILVKNKVAVFSSNYTLYGDMSKRVMRTISQFSDEVEQCSIDEVFAAFEIETDNVEEERKRITELSEEIYKVVLKATGIPVRVSMAETKTLAKVGSEYTKRLLKEKKIPAVCFWKHPEKENFMKSLPVGKVWGIGRQWVTKVEAVGIKTAYDLSIADPTMMRQLHNILVEKTIVDISGVSCIPLELTHEKRKSLIRSRTFAKRLHDPKMIMQAISNHVAHGAEKLREEKLMCGEITVYLSTPRHGSQRYNGSESAKLIKPTNDTLILNRVATNLFRKAYVSRNAHGELYQYAKAGVVFRNLNHNHTETQSLFEFANHDKPEIMQALDAINKRYGDNSIVVAAMGLPDKLKGIIKGKKDATAWSMKRNLMSPRYTTDWDELMKVRLK